jgi:predicted RNA-binding protein with PUA-like domain
MQYWLLKTEPRGYSIDDLKRDGCTPWSGVRNYQARNFMRDGMQVGDRVFFYHSNVAEPAIVGLAHVCSEPYPDPTAFDVRSKYYDEKSTRDKPRWFLVDVCFDTKLARPITLKALRADPTLGGLLVLAPHQRLSVMPVEKMHGDRIEAMSHTMHS